MDELVPLPDGDEVDGSVGVVDEQRVNAKQTASERSGRSHFLKMTPSLGPTTSVSRPRFTTLAHTDDVRRLVGVADGGEQHELPDLQRHVVMLALEAERAGHAATAGVEEFVIELHGIEDAALRIHFHDRAMMTVAVDDRLAMKLRERDAGRVAIQELAEREGLPPQSRGTLV